MKIEVDWWSASLKLLGDTKLLQTLVEYDIENIEEATITRLGKFIKDPENEKNLEVNTVSNASPACKCIVMWITGVYNFYFVNKKVKPKKKSLAESTSKVQGLNA